jgi:hypothetical protein
MSLPVSEMSVCIVHFHTYELYLICLIYQIDMACSALFLFNIPFSLLGKGMSLSWRGAEVGSVWEPTDGFSINPLFTPIFPPPPPAPPPLSLPPPPYLLFPQSTASYFISISSTHTPHALSDCFVQMSLLHLFPPEFIPIS